MPPIRTREKQAAQGLEVAPRPAKRLQWTVSLLRDTRRTEIAFQHVPFEILLNAFDAVFPIDGLKLFRHLSNNREKSNPCANRPVFDRLPNEKPVSHVTRPVRCCGLGIRPPIANTSAACRR